MSETKWTLGPWTQRGLSDHVRIERRNAVGYLNIARCGSCKPGRHEPEMAEVFANAHLIAAAPELYAALESALALLEVVEGAGVAEFAGSLASVPSNCRAALAKARGEEPKP